MTTLNQALRDAGLHASAERLREIAMQALHAHPTDPLKRRAAIVAGVGNDAALLWELFARYLADATDRLVASVRNDMLVNQRTGQYRSETRASGARAAPLDRDGDRRSFEAHARRVPATGAGTGGQDAVETHRAIAPGAGAEAVAAVVRLSLLDSFRINGQPLGDVTVAEARLWAEARGKQARRDARFIELITAGLPDGMPIRRFRHEDEAAAAWAQALQEAV